MSSNADNGQGTARSSKAPSQSAAKSVTNPFQSRPFAIQAKPEHCSPQQELPDSETQQETVKRFGQNLAKISISAPSTPTPDAWKQSQTTQITQTGFAKTEKKSFNINR